MARRRVEVRRDEILAATISELESRGLAQTRVSDVASALGISPGLIFYHFATKDALLVAAFERAVNQDLALLEVAVRRGTDATDRLRRVLAVYGPTGAAFGWRLWIDAWALALRNAAIRTTLRRLDDRWRLTLVDVVESGVNDGVFTCEDPVASVSRVSALLDGLAVASLSYRNITRTQLRTWVREAMARELGLDPGVLR
ncbi:MAG TPA: TetR/AcrR family transcriptional regulator [Nocardioidaceae bacterium]|jgi:AcrR family transcriptional regulator|nr:TetR/AcrR family transcriptional regulator [Nocardioidaceae bacterium]